MQWVEHPCPTNRYERNLYPLIQGGKGIPRLWAAGVQGDWDYLAIDLLGQSLDNIYRKSGKDVMNLGSVCCIAMQVVCGMNWGWLGDEPLTRESTFLRFNDLNSCTAAGCFTATFSWEIVYLDYLLMTKSFI